MVPLSEGKSKDCLSNDLAQTFIEQIDRGLRSNRTVVVVIWEE